MSGRRLASFKRVFNENCPPRFCCGNREGVADIEIPNLNQNGFGNHDQNSRGNLVTHNENTPERESPSTFRDTRKRELNTKKRELQAKKLDVEDKRRSLTLVQEALNGEQNMHLRAAAEKDSMAKRLVLETKSKEESYAEASVRRKIVKLNYKMAFG